MNIQKALAPTNQLSRGTKLFCLDSIVGVTIFDINGLPKEYYGTADNDDTSWTQAVFAAIGLKVLLESAFQLDHFHHSIMHATFNPVFVFKLRTYYVAFLLSPINFRDVADRIAEEIDQFDPSMLILEPQFSVVVGLESLRGRRLIRLST